MGEYERGFAAGWQAYYYQSIDTGRSQTVGQFVVDRDAAVLSRTVQGRSKPKRKQSGKQKILTQMAKKAWDKYKKGNGKKSYIDIRAQVSRSQAYKKATKGM